MRATAARCATWCALLATAACAPGPRTEDGAGAGTTRRFEAYDLSGRWYKGNTHTHTDESDGDSPPEYVARWYKDHGYDFLVLSDHNVFTDPATLSHLVDSTFLLIPGEELSSSFASAPIHVNGLNLPGVVEARGGESVVATIQANVDAVREVDGVPHVNHPNFRWAFGAEELRQVRGDRLLEIWNGHPTVHNEGGGGVPSVEEVWDELLTGGKRIYGIAVDDAHHFQGEFAPDRYNPGRGWIAVRAGALDAGALMEALEEGRFYASTGVEIEEITVSARTLSVRVREQGDYRHTTRFIGAGGAVLAETFANPAVYELAGDEPYVRARVTDSGGRIAWTQPIFTEPR